MSAHLSISVQAPTHPFIICIYFIKATPPLSHPSTPVRRHQHPPVSAQRHGAHSGLLSVPVTPSLCVVPVFSLTESLVSRPPATASPHSGALGPLPNKPPGKSFSGGEMVPLGP